MNLATALEQATRAFGPPNRPGPASRFGWVLPSGRFLAIFDLDGKHYAAANLYADDKHGPLLAELGPLAFDACPDIAAWANAPYGGAR